MGILGGNFKGDEDDDLGGESLTLNMDAFVCPTCGRELPPWATACPDDGATPVKRVDQMASGTPDIPAHLLEGLDDIPAPAEDDAEDDPADAPTTDVTADEPGRDRTRDDGDDDLRWPDRDRPASDT